MISQRLKNMAKHMDQKIKGSRKMDVNEQKIIANALSDMADQVQAMERNCTLAEMTVVQTH